MRPVPLSTLAFTFIGTTLLCLGVFAVETGQIWASAVIGAVQFGLTCAIAVVVFSLRKH